MCHLKPQIRLPVKALYEKFVLNDSWGAKWNQATLNTLTMSFNVYLFIQAY